VGPLLGILARVLRPWATPAAWTAPRTPAFRAPPTGW